MLHRYFARRFAASFLGATLVLGLILTSVNLAEKLGDFSDADVSFAQVIGLTLLDLPRSIYAIMPLIMIIAAISLFLSLARSSELVVTRASGRSALRALMAPGTVALMIGVLAVVMFNPIVAATSREYERRVAAVSGQSNTVLVGRNGLWLRQGNDQGQTVIRAARTNETGTELWEATFITFTREGGPVRRVEAEYAALVNGFWETVNAKVWPLTETTNPETIAETHAAFNLPSSLTPDQIRDSFGEPSSIPLWDLPSFIKRLETAGFSSARHVVWFQMELAQPVFLLSMMLIGAGFTMRHQRAGRTWIMVLAAIVLSFGIYFLRNFAQIMGENEQIPAVLAAWAPPLAAIGLSLGLLLHLEDG